MTDALNRIPIGGEPLEPRYTAGGGDADADGVSDVEEMLAGTDPNDPDISPGPVLETTLPPLGTSAVASVEPITVDPVVTVATATPGDSTLDGATVGGIAIDLSPSHLGIDLDVGGLSTPNPLGDAMGFGSPAGVTVSAAPSGSGSLGPLPAMGLVAADGDGESTTADAGGNIITTKTATTENDKGTTTTTETTTEGSHTKVVETKIETTEKDGDVVTITKTESYRVSADGQSWVKESATVNATGTNNGEPFEWNRQTYPPGAEYDTGAGEEALPAELSAIVTQMVTTGVDPTTTTPGRPLDDDGGEAVDAGDVSGAVTSLGVRVPREVADGGIEVQVVGDGNPSTGLIVGGPDTVDPNDPTIGGGGEPITAADLTNPQPSNANPTSSTSSAMRIDGGVAGGEDEDLDDLDLEQSTAGTSTSTWVPVGEAGSVGTIHEVDEAGVVAEPVTIDVPIRVVEASLGGPVLDVELGTPPAMGEPSGLAGIEPEVTVATTLPGGLPVDAGLDAFSIGDLRTGGTPNHYGIDTSLGESAPSTIAEIVDVGFTATATAVPAATTGSGTLGPLPGSSLYSSGEEGDDGDVAGKEQPKPWVDPATKPKPEEPGLWETFKSWIDPAGGTTTTKPDAGTPNTNPKQPLKPFPGDKYDNPDAEPDFVEPTDIVRQIVTTGIDPTTTTPTGPYVDDGGAEPVTSDDVAGAGPVGGLHAPVNPLVIDGIGDDVGIVGTGDPQVPIVAEGPDVIGPNDPVLGGAGPITAGDLTPRPGTANPIAGGEDEDLEDLEIQRLTPGPTPTSGVTGDMTTASTSQPMTAAVEPVEPVPAPVVPMARGRGMERDVDRGGHGGRGHDDGGFDVEPVVAPEVEAPVPEPTHGDPIELFGDDATGGDIAPVDDGTDWDTDG